MNRIIYLLLIVTILPYFFGDLFPDVNGYEVRAEVIQDEASVLPLSLPIGQTAGLAINSENNVVLFHRSGRVWNQGSFDLKNLFNKKLGPIANSTIAVLNGQNGNLLEEHGKGKFYMPHGLAVDSTDNYWLTDVGAHQVYKLDKNFKPLMVLGEKLVPGRDDKHFCKPTDVVVASTGEFFVADGYCNSRIMKFSRDGRLVAKFGKPNTSKVPKEGEFFTPHSIALIEDLDLLCVADRDNERIQCFSAGLNRTSPVGLFYTKAEGIGRVFAIREKEHYLVGLTNYGEQNQEMQVFIMDIMTGKVYTLAKGLDNAHSITINDNGDIFVSQMDPSQIVKFSFPAEAMEAN